MQKLPLALAFATLERPQVVQRLIVSIRKFRPEIRIYVADQSRRPEAMAEFYRAFAVTVIPMPFDAGVTASRNRLVEAISEDYFVLCDDDFILDARTDYTDAVRILEAEPGIAVVGGRLFDYDGQTERLRNWELFLQYDRTNKILFSIPIYQLAPKAREIGHIRYFLCDAVLNFAVFRRAIFQQGARWDERFKSNGEHEDFYLNLKLNTPFKVAYLPTLVAYHHHPEVCSQYRSRLRERNEGWRQFFEKWGLEQHIEYGLGVRTIDDIERIVPEKSVCERFFINPNLSLQGGEIAPGTLLVGEDDTLSPVGVLTSAGESVGGFKDRGELLLGQGLPPVPIPAVASAAAATEVQLAERYQLEASVKATVVADPGAQLYFRYDPVWCRDSDFYLWYYCVAPQARDGAAPRRQVAVARWWDQQGRCLVWRSHQIFFDLRASRFWQPILLQIPLATEDCRRVRFDIVTDAGPKSSPICTGLLFREHGRDSRDAASRREQPEALALGRIPHDGADSGLPGEMLKDVIRRAPPLKAKARTCACAPDLSLLSRDEMTGLDVLYFVGWESLGRNLVSARLPRDEIPAPNALALPHSDWSLPGRKVLGFGERRGLVSLSV
jgi:hypothetical protein